MKKFRSLMAGKPQEAQPGPVSIHVESTATALDELRGQATWEEEWLENHPGLNNLSNHERKVHLLGDLLGEADGVRAFREVLSSCPDLRELLEPRADPGHEEIEPDLDGDYEAIAKKLGEGQQMLINGTASDAQNSRTQQGELQRTSKSPQEFYQHRNRLRALLEREENDVCADCDSKHPTWASVNIGVFLCTQCSGCHRALGVHISKVLSVQLDDWTAEQVQFMGEMGNELVNSFLEYHVPHKWLKPSHLEPRDYREAYIKAKYQEREFAFRGRKKAVIKPPPSVGETSSPAPGDRLDLSRMSSGSGHLSHGMMEYIGFVNISLARGRHLVGGGFVSQLQYMAVLRIGSQEVRSRWVKADANPVWAEKLMLCWDGNMPLNIDVFGSKDHIGQAQVPLAEYLLGPCGEDESMSQRGNNHCSPSFGGAGPGNRRFIMDVGYSNDTAQSIQDPPGATSGAVTSTAMLGSSSSHRTSGIPGLETGMVPALSTPGSSSDGIGGSGRGSWRPATSGSAAGATPATNKASTLSGMTPRTPGDLFKSAFAGRSGTPHGETLSPGELYFPLKDRPEPRTSLSPRQGSGSTTSSPAGDRSTSSAQNGVSNGAYGAAGGGSTANGVRANASSGKSLNSMLGGFSKSGRRGSTSGDRYPSRPAQGGVVLKMDFVRIEH